MQALIFINVAAGSYFLMSIVQTVLHRYYGIPIVVFTAAIYVAFGPLVTTAHLVGVFLTFAWHVYLHRQYHLIDTLMGTRKD